MLFEREGATFSEFVREQRLACAHRLLSDLRRADRTITAIALAAASVTSRTSTARSGVPTE
jgi:hypothetical protein